PDRPPRVADRGRDARPAAGHPCVTHPPSAQRKVPPMSDAPASEHVEPELVEESADKPAADGRNSVDEPAKVLRVGTMIRQLLEEVRATELDQPSRDPPRGVSEN